MTLKNIMPRLLKQKTTYFRMWINAILNIKIHTNKNFLIKEINMTSNKKINNILNKEIKLISLSNKQEKEIEKKAEYFVSLVNNIIKKMKIKAQARTGGSLAKKTLINKEVQDIDIFIVFERREDMEKNFYNIIERLERKLSKNKNIEIRKKYGSRDYFQISRENIVFELRPVLNIRKHELKDRQELQQSNITDLSLLHVE